MKAEWSKDTPYSLPDSWDEEIDVVIVGSGFSGLSAAIEVASSGLKTIIFEKMPYVGGNSSLAGGGVCSWDSKLKMREKLGLGDDSWQQHFADTMKGGDYYNDPALVEVMVKSAPETIDWLVDIGVEFADMLPILGGHSAHRGYRETSSSGRKMVEAIKTRALAENVDIRYNSEVCGIWRENAKAPVSGISVTNKAGIFNIKANKGVILTAGGFGRDREMIKESQPAISDELGCNNHKGASGEVIRYAKAIGADTINMQFIQCYPCGNPNTGGMDRFAFCSYSGAGYGLIYVNKEGNRFVNELAGRDEVSNAQLRFQEKPTWGILNAKLFEFLGTSEQDLDRAVESGRIVKADGIRKLAESIGFSAETLSATVDNHNGYIEAGKDPDFEKVIFDQLIPLEEGPFYAIPQWPTIHYCMGGLKINTDTEVCDIWGVIIPGLYAAGEVTGGVHGSNRLAGNAITDCLVFGRRAGKKVAGLLSL